MVAEGLRALAGHQSSKSIPTMAARPFFAGIALRRLALLLASILNYARSFSAASRITVRNIDPCNQQALTNEPAPINHGSRAMYRLKAADTNQASDDNFYRKLELHIKETPEEAWLRRLWDANPFETVTAFVQSIVVSPEVAAPSRQRLCSTDFNDGKELLSTLRPLPKEYRELFARAFEPPCDDQPTFATPVKRIGAGEHLTVDNKEEEYKGFYSFRLDIAYMGEAFCGWQTQPNNKERPSVQETLEKCLQPMFQPSRRSKKYFERTDNQSESPNQKEKKRMKEPRVNIRVAGRTDSGVHAIGQVARFRTWTKGGGKSTFQWNDFGLSSTNDLDPSIQLQNYINQHSLAGKTFRCLSVTPVSSNFHPTFGASRRAYLYLIDASSIHQLLDAKSGANTLRSLEELVERLNAMLRTLEQKELDYIAMSYGKVKTQSTLCNLYVARAMCVNLMEGDTHGVDSALCIQLVGDRFLRRMALRESLLFDTFEEDQLGDSSKRLLNILLTKDRKMSAQPAPPQGLLFAGASFD